MLCRDSATDNPLIFVKNFLLTSSEKEKIIVSLPKIIKSIFIKMKSIGNTLRELRENKLLPLRVVAAFLDIDPAIMSRIERGQRNASREQVVKLAEYFNVDENELLVAWLSDKVVYELAYEQNAIEALKVAEDKIKYNITQKI
jgi:transcriptional regulator with XRE-family HTH domain